MNDRRPEPQRARRNEAAKAQFLAGLAAMRRGALEAARALLAIDRDAHFVFEGCASVAEFGERHGASAAETMGLLSMGRALEVCPELEGRVQEGRIPMHGAALVGKVLGNPAHLRPGDDWLAIAEASSVKDLRRRVDQRIEETRLGQVPPVALTVFVSPQGRDDFARARAVASRKADRSLTNGETLETLADHYLRTFDPDRKRAASRRLPHTSTVPGRYVPAEVQRALRARDGDRCALPFCDHEVFLENAHVVAHAAGGHREADNLLRLCAKHHRMLDEGRLRVMGPADAPRFADAEGRTLDRRRLARSRDSREGESGDPPSG